MYVCLCNAVTDKQIQQTIEEGACSFNCLVKQLGVASQCGCCSEQIKQMLADAKTAPVVYTPTHQTDNPQPYYPAKLATA